MIRKHNFNMIEVVLALMVVSIGIMSIMGLVPIGAKAHSDAISYNRAADVAADALHQAAVDIQPDWETYAVSTPITLPTFKQTRAVRDRETGKVIRTVDDFDVEVVITRDTVTGYYYDKSSPTPIQSRTLPNMAILHAVASWPTSQDYSKRTKAYFSLEVTKQ